MSDNFLKIYNGVAMTPRNTDPSNPTDGDLQFSDGTHRDEGLWQYFDGDWQQMGSGGTGGSGINYITNNDGETDTTGWATYADAAGENPVDGTGGSPSLVFNQVASAALRGSGHFQIAKTSANEQGEGVSYDFTIDNADKSQKLTISFDYDASHVNYNDDDIRMSVYDVTNSRLIRISGEDLKGGKGKHYAQFQTSPDSTSYRLIFHISTTNSSNYTVDFDTVSVGPGPSSGTNQEVIAVGSGNGGTSITANVTNIDFTQTKDTTSSFDGSIFTVPESGEYIISGSIAATSSSTGTPVLYVDNTSLKVVGDNNISNSIKAFNGIVSLNKGQLLSIRITSSITLNNNSNHHIHINKVGTNTETNSVGGGRDVAAITYLGSAANHTAVSAFQKVPLNTTENDSTGSFDSSNNYYVVPETGYYTISAAVGFASIASTKVMLACIGVNGGNTFFGSTIPSGATSGNRSQVSANTYLNKGDTVELRAFQNDTASEAYSIGRDDTYLTLIKISSPQAILETETVAARYTSSNGQSVPTSLGTNFIAETKITDTHSAYNTSTGEYTVPVSGIYDVNVKMHCSASDFLSNGAFFQCLMQNNGSNVDELFFTKNSTSAGNMTDVQGNGSCIIELSKGDVITIDFRENSSDSLSLSTNGFQNVFSIARIK